MKKIIFRAMLTITIIVITACGSKQVATISEDESDQLKPGMSNEEVTEEVNVEINHSALVNDVKEIITGELGEKNNLDKNYIDDVTLEDSHLTIPLNGDDDETSTLIKNGMLMKSSVVIRAIENKHKFEIISISWKYPLEDENGNQSDEFVLSFDLDRETLNNINWENFMYEDFPNIGQFYWEHIAVSG